MFAPLGGFIIDATSFGVDRVDVKSVVVEKSTYSAVIYVYLALKLVSILYETFLRFVTDGEVKIGATTFCITTFSLMTFIKMTLSI